MGTSPGDCLSLEEAAERVSSCLQMTVLSLVPEGEAGALLWPLPGTMALRVTEGPPGEGGEEGEWGHAQGPDSPQGTASWGEGACLDHPAFPSQLQKLPSVQGVQAAGPGGPGQGCTALRRRSCLRKPSGLARGQGGGLSMAVGTSLLQTLFSSSRRQSCP